MRPDRRKLNSQKKEGAKRERKDLENRRQPKSAARQDLEAKKSGQGYVLRLDEKSGHRLH